MLHGAGILIYIYPKNCTVMQVNICKYSRTMEHLGMMFQTSFAQKTVCYPLPVEFARGYHQGADARQVATAGEESRGDWAGVVSAVWNWGTPKFHTLSDLSDLPSGNLTAIKNGDLSWVVPLKSVIFHSYVKLPEGIHYFHHENGQILSPLFFAT